MGPTDAPAPLRSFEVGVFLTSHLLTLDLSAWCARGSTVALLTVSGLAAYGFKTSMVGAPLLPVEWLRLGEPRVAMSRSSS